MNKITNSLLFCLFLSFGFAQDGKILAKRPVDLSKTPIWSKISSNDKLLPKFKHLERLQFYFITYESDSLKVGALMVEPKKKGKYPVIIFNRGGNRDFGKLTIATLITFASNLADNGYIVIGSNYREEDEFGGKDINDVLNLMETIKEIENADSTCIGMFGWSRGGMMTYLALKKSNKIKTAIIGNGATNMFNSVKFRPEMETNVYAECIPNYWKNKKEELKNRSAAYWHNQLSKNSSLLILSGTKDKRVNPTQADSLVILLKEINYNFEHRKFETDHFFSDKRMELGKLMINWYDENLKKPCGQKPN